MKELLIKLMDYGLEEREAALYLASLEVGESGMTAIAKKAKIKRSTAYLTFKTLEARGLMGSLKMRDGLHFIATKPELFFAREERRLKDLSSLLPQFKELSVENYSKPNIIFYEGKEGTRIALEGSLKTMNTKLRYIGSFEEVYKMVGDDYDKNHYMPKRVKRGIAIRNLTFDDFTEKSRKWINQDTDSKYLRETRYLPKEYTFGATSLICNDQVIIFGGGKENIVIVIESKEIAFSEQQKFDLIWNLIGQNKQGE
jgi:sugar-specific transcriptional regulator TrmB